MNILSIRFARFAILGLVLVLTPTKSSIAMKSNSGLYTAFECSSEDQLIHEVEIYISFPYTYFANVKSAAGDSTRYGIYVGEVTNSHARISMITTVGEFHAGRMLLTKNSNSTWSGQIQIENLGNAAVVCRKNPPFAELLVARCTGERNVEIYLTEVFSTNTVFNFRVHIEPSLHGDYVGEAQIRPYMVDSAGIHLDMFGYSDARWLHFKPGAPSALDGRRLNCVNP